jgi:hypothetical protein
MLKYPRGYHITMKSKNEYYQGTVPTMVTNLGSPLTRSITTGFTIIDFKWWL